MVGDVESIITLALLLCFDARRDPVYGASLILVATSLCAFRTLVD